MFRTSSGRWPARFRTILGAGLVAGLGMVSMAIPASADTVGLGVSSIISGAGFTSSEVLYASTVLGGENGVNGCNVGLCTQLTDPTSSLTTSPTSTAPGQLAYSLNLNAEGSNSSTSASLANGSTGISLSSRDNSVAPETLVSGGVIMEDGLTFNVAGGGSADIGVTLTLNGTINVPTDGSYVQTILMDLGLAQFQWGASFENANGGTPVSNTEPGTENWVSFSTPTNTATSLVFNGVMSVTSGQDLQFLLNQQLSCNVGASCDFGDPLQISFNLPTGVTFTSDSGVFLSGASTTTATPEPNAVALMGFGGLALALVAWRRRPIAS